MLPSGSLLRIILTTPKKLSSSVVIRLSPLWLYFCMFIMLVGAEINVAWNSTYRRIAGRIYRRTRSRIKSLTDGEAKEHKPEDSQADK